MKYLKGAMILILIFLYVAHLVNVVGDSNSLPDGTTVEGKK